MIYLFFACIVLVSFKMLLEIKKYNEVDTESAKEKRSWIDFDYNEEARN